MSLCEMAIGKFPLTNAGEGDAVAMQKIAAGKIDISVDLLKEGCSPHFCDIVLNRWEIFPY